MGIKLPKITPCLCFDHQAEEAVNYYVSIFKNSWIRNITRVSEEEQYGIPGAVRTISFVLDGHEMMAANGGPTFVIGDGVSLYVACDSQQEIDMFWEKLSEGGEKQECGWLKDKFGVFWQIAPSNAWELVNDPDPAKSKRVTDAIFGMTKLSMEQIQAAYSSD